MTLTPSHCIERGPWLKTQEFTHDLQLGTYTKLVDYRNTTFAPPAAR
jgi:hypothetical protein